MAVDSISIARPGLKVPADVYLAEYRELQDFVDKALIRGADYGTLGDDGKGKPILFLPGAEKLADAYGLTGGAPELLHTVETWEADIPFFHYVLRVPFQDRATGAIVGYGIGSCNTMEIKYRYRTEKVWCNKPADANQAPGEEEGWELKTTQRGKKYWQKKIANPETPDLANTILKMAAKRAYVDGVLKILRASALFTQDLEDMPASLTGATAEHKEFFCAKQGCGAQIVDAKIGKHDMTADQIAAETAKEFGRALCPACWKAAIAERKGASSSQGGQQASDQATNPTMQRLSIITKIASKAEAYGGNAKVTEYAMSIDQDYANWRDIQDIGVLSRILAEVDSNTRKAA